MYKAVEANNKGIVWYLDSKTTAKYGDEIDHVLDDFNVAVEVDGQLYSMQRIRDRIPQHIELTRDIFPGLPKPGLFRKNKEFDIRIHHIARGGPIYQIEDWEVKDPETGEICFYCSIPSLTILPRLYPSGVQKAVKICNEMNIPVEPGKVLLTEEQFFEFAKSKICQIMFKARKKLGHLEGTPHIVADKSTTRLENFEIEVRTNISDLYRTHGVPLYIL